MKKFYQNILILMVAFIVLPFIVSCSDDEEVNEWEANYVYLQREDYTQIPSFVLTHTPLGVTGDVIQKFLLKVQRPVDKDIHARLSVTCTDFDSKYVSLSESEVIVRANELASDTINVSIPDLSFMNDTKEAADYHFEVKIESLEPHDSALKISDLQQVMKITVNKEAYAFYKYGAPANSNFVSNRLDWTVTLGEGLTGLAKNVIDGQSNTVVSRSEGKLEVMLDFGSMQNLVGIRTMHTYSYTPTEVELFTSENGNDWHSLGVYERVASTTEPITFLAPIQTRYLKYTALNSKGKINLGEFHIYTPKE